jgi:hypothetical protein
MDWQAGIASGAAHAVADCIWGSISAKASGVQLFLTAPMGNESICEEIIANTEKSGSLSSTPISRRKASSQRHPSRTGLSPDKTPLARKTACWRMLMM